MADTSERFFYACTCITSFLGIPANVLVIIYFTFGNLQVHDATKLLYRAIAITDLILATTLLGYAIPHLSGIQIMNGVVCEMLEFCAETTLRLLYLLICLLAVLRAMVVMNPLKNPLNKARVKTLRWIVIVSVLLLVGQSLVPLIIRQMNPETNPPCQISTVNTFSNPLVRKIWRLFTILMQVVLAMLVMLLANGASIYHLLKTDTITAGHEARMRAAKTTLVLTMVFFFLHVTGIVTETARVVWEVKLGTNNLISNGFTVLSPIVDPAVYFLGMSGVWKFWKVLMSNFLTALGRPFRSYKAGLDGYTITERNESNLDVTLRGGVVTQFSEDGPFGTTVVLSPRASPQMNRLSPQMNRLSPRASPQMSRLSPQMSRLSPQMSRLSPQSSRLSPRAINRV